jgi:hypothetical protein
MLNVAVSMAMVDDIIRTFEAEKKRRVSIPARLVIQQFFLALATDHIGFTQLMSDSERQKAIQTAHDNLRGFLDNLDKKAKALTASPVMGLNTPTKPEIGLLLIVQNINSWALNISCPCWPR